MTVVIGTTASLANNDSINIRPSSTDEEWTIHNIYVPKGYTVEVYRWNSTSTTPQILITSISETLSLMGAFHATFTDFIIVKNTSGSTIYISYDGINLLATV